MPVDPMFWLATAAFAWGLSLASYRWFAIHNNWPMGEWQAHRPGLAIAIGLFAVLFAVLFALARGGTTVLILPLFGTVCALLWTALTRVGAQSALLLAPAAVIALLAVWILAASAVVPEQANRAVTFEPETRFLPAATEREGTGAGRDRGISFGQSRPAAEPEVLPPIRR
jgi:hypothetical protein